MEYSVSGEVEGRQGFWGYCRSGGCDMWQVLGSVSLLCVWGVEDVGISVTPLRV